ncbi:MAG: TetR/AcrR family transcriptional regulator [Pseudomonadales bacterium]
MASTRLHDLDPLSPLELPPLGEVLPFLEVFAQRGFPRTTMGSLADAGGVSRQTLYNRFGNKEELFHWAADAFSKHLERDALAALDRPDLDLADQLLAHYCAWFEPMVTLLNQGPYAQALFGLGLEGKRAAGYDPLDSVSTAVAARLLAQAPDAGVAAAEDRAFALAMAAKGLFMNARNAEDFRRALVRVLRGHGLTPNAQP